MNKADYQDPSRYAPAEHRMVIALRAVRDVRIVNLTLQSSGGDGIYVGGYGTNGYCENVLIDRVVCDDHHRLGMAVISAANLTVRDSVFKNTRGTNPNSGVDMEPNYPGERLSGIRFENCVFENNTLAGLYISCGLNGEAEPVGITARHCVFRGNANGLNIAFHSKTTPPRGSVEFLDCEFYGNGAGISLNDPAAEGASVAFIRCTLSADTASCPFAVMGAARERIGNLHVSDLVVRTPAGCRSPVSFGSAPGAALTNITGRLLWDRGGQTSVLDLAELIRSSAWAPSQSRCARSATTSASGSPSRRNS